MQMQTSEKMLILFRVMHDAWTKGHFIMSLVTGLVPLPEEFFGLIIWEMPASRDEI